MRNRLPLDQSFEIEFSVCDASIKQESSFGVILQVANSTTGLLLIEVLAYEYPLFFSVVLSLRHVGVGRLKRRFRVEKE